MFLVDKPKECIALVRSKFLLAKAAAALAETNRRMHQVGGIEIRDDAATEKRNNAHTTAEGAQTERQSSHNGNNDNSNSLPMHTIGGPSADAAEEGNMEPETPADESTGAVELAAASSNVDSAVPSPRPSLPSRDAEGEQDSAEPVRGMSDLVDVASTPLSSAVGATAATTAVEAQAPRLAVEPLSPPMQNALLSPSAEDLLDL